MWEMCPHHSVAGVSALQLVDVDESYVYLCDTHRGYGFALEGRKAEIVGRYIKGIKWTVMLAVGKNGVINYWVHRENTSGEVCLVDLHVVVCCWHVLIMCLNIDLQLYAQFLEHLVFPKLTVPCYIMNDNLPAHFGEVTLIWLTVNYSSLVCSLSRGCSSACRTSHCRDRLPIPRKPLLSSSFIC
jgi:hypothetical protein